MITGAAEEGEAGGAGAATAGFPAPPPPPLPTNYPLDALGRVRTRGDLAALINEGVDSVTIKTEISGDGYEQMEDDSEEVICTVSLDERNRIIAMDDPFRSDEQEDEEDYDGDSQGEEILEESEDGTDEAAAEEGLPPGNGEVPVPVVPEVPAPGAADDTVAAANTEREEEDDRMDNDGEGRNNNGAGENEIEIETASEPAVVCKHPDNMYKPVRSVLSAGQLPMKLNPRMKLNNGQDPGFMVPGDERILRNANMCSLEEKRICSTSFDPVSARCFTCLNGDHRAWAARDGGPICIILTDQHFPANIPADSAGECMRVLRTENGSLTEMADELLKLVPQDGIPKGSVILYGSTAYMGIVSAERYAAEWAKNRNWLLDRLGEVIILPGIPLTSSGIVDRCVLRNLLDLSAWYDSMPDPELRLLRNARKCWEDTYLGKIRRGPGWADYRLNMVMPVSLSKDAGTIPSTSGDWGERPTVLIALNEAGERYWIEKITQELNREIGLGLATAWSVGRTLSAVRRQEEAVAIGRVFSIGASNAGHTAAALERKGIRVVPITTPGCTVTREGVDGILRHLASELRKDDIILVQWFENSIFFMLNTETGSMELPSRNEQDGIFHVTGKVTVSKDMQLDALLNKLEPLLAENPDNLKVLLCPLVRYLEDCCAAHPRDESLKKEDGVRQLKELYQFRRVLKSWIIRRKFRNTIMLDPLGCLGAAASLDKAKSVMADCFHLNIERLWLEG